MILFIDFDGVLHPVGAPVDRLFENAPAIAAALAGSGIEVVVSSSWSEYFPLDALIEFVAPICIRGAIGKVPGQRGAACAAWVQANRPGSLWWALDDERDQFAGLEDHVLWCDAEDAVTMVEALVSALDGETR